MNCTNPITLKSPDLIKYPAGLVVPCGKCISCRIQKRKEWSIRLAHELQFHREAMFVTLTYDDEHLPHNASLDKKEVQKFMKRVRKAYPEKIKYFLCGEYGKTRFRPHYHAIMLGIGLKSKRTIMECWPNCNWFNQDIQDNSFGLVEPKSIEYVTGYINDKLSGDLATEIYDATGREHPFRLVSRGIGLRYCESMKHKLEQDLFVSYRGVKYALPRYYLDKIEVDQKRLDEQALIRESEITSHYINIHVPFRYAVDALTYDQWHEVKQGVMKAREQRNNTEKARIDLKAARGRF